MEDSMKKIKIVKSVTLAKKIKTAKPATPTKNIVSVPIESIFASIFDNSLDISGLTRLER